MSWKITPKGVVQKLGTTSIYSLVETAKANGLIPFDYIKLLLDELTKQPDSVDHLLPWKVDLK